MAENLWIPLGVVLSTTTQICKNCGQPHSSSQLFLQQQSVGLSSRAANRYTAIGPDDDLPKQNNLFWRHDFNEEYIKFCDTCFQEKSSKPPQIRTIAGRRFKPTAMGWFEEVEPPAPKASDPPLTPFGDL